MKSVLYIISGFDISKNNGVMNRCLSFVNCFSSHGYKVTVLALPHVKQFFKSNKRKKAMPGNARWMAFPHYYSYRPSVLNLFAYVEKFFILVKSCIIRPSYILADGCVSCYLSSWAAHHFRLIANYRADMADEYLLLHNLPHDTIETRRIRRMDVNASKLAKYTICVSTNLKKHLLLTGADLKNNFIFPCCADLQRFNDVKPNTGGRIIVGYFGGTSPWQCITQVIELVVALRKISDDYKLLLLCSGDLTEYQERLDVLGSDNYSVRSLSSPEMPRAIASMDISVAFRSNRNLNVVSSPTKLSESLAAGVPLIVSRFCGDYNDILIEGVNGVVTNDIYPTEKELLMIDSFCRKVKSNRQLYFDTCRASVKQRTQALYSDGFIKMIES